MKKLIFIFGLVWLISATTAQAQGNAFNFQGRLNDGTNPANGSYDLQFSLFNAVTGGTQIGSLVARPNTTLINGVFSVTLDFGATAFNNPNSIFIEIGVKPNASPNAFTILGPRQQLTVVPFAVRAMNSTNADFSTNAQNAVNAQNATNAVNSQNSVNATNATNATNAANSSALNGLASTDFIRNSTTTQPSSNFNISGNGVINGNLNVAGNIVNGGNVSQNRDKNGLVKAMVYINSDGSILRCYNGITGATTGNCGFTSGPPAGGYYGIDFGFQINDRFVSATPLRAGGNVNIGVNFSFSGANGMLIRSFITDVDYLDSGAANPFIVIVY